MPCEARMRSQFRTMFMAAFPPLPSCQARRCLTPRPNGACLLAPQGRGTNADLPRQNMRLDDRPGLVLAAGRVVPAREHGATLFDGILYRVDVRGRATHEAADFRNGPALEHAEQFNPHRLQL